MEDREKRINEMSRDMCFCDNCSVVGRCYELNCETTWVAEKLIDLNYQKISPDDIVISKEDYNDELDLTRRNTIERLLDFLWTSKDMKQEILSIILNLKKRGGCYERK